MKNKKSIFALFLALCLVFTLAACNGNGYVVDVMPEENAAVQEPIAPVALPEVIVVEAIEEVEEEEVYAATPVVQLAARPAAPQVPAQPELPEVDEPDCDTYEGDHEYDEAVTLPCEVDPDALCECEYGYCDCDADEPGYVCEEAGDENCDDYYNDGDESVDEEKEDEITEEPPVTEPEEPVVPDSDDAPVVYVPDVSASEEA